MPSEYDLLKRRRDISRAMQERAMQPYQTQMVSGRAVPFSVGKGLTDIASAYFGRKGEEKAEKELATGTSEATQRVIEQMQGRSAVGQRGPQIPVTADPMGAQLTAATDPFLSENKALQNVMLAQAKAKSANSVDPYFTQFIGQDGKAYSFNARTGETAPLGLVSGKLDPETQRNIAREKQMGLGGAEAVTDPETAGKVVTAKALAEREAEKVIQRPKIDSTIAAADTNIKMVGGQIDKAIDQAGAWTTGFLGAGTSWIPGTPAHDLNATLDTIKANIGFDKLQEMRNNSPTGGALGQVSEFENRLLQNVWGALQQSQSPEQFKENLRRVKQQSAESWTRLKKAYKDDYGVEYGGATPADGTTQTFDIKSVPSGWDAEDYKYLTDEEKREAHE